MKKIILLICSMVLTNTIVWAQWGNGISLDGKTSQYLYANGYNTITDNFTMEAWVKWNGVSVTTTQNIVSNGRAGENGYTLGLYTDNKISILINNVIWLTSDSTLTIGEWTHLAFTKSGNIWKLYKNGVEILSATNAGVVTPNSKFYVGGEDGAYPMLFKGVIDEVRFSNNVRYTSNFATHFEPFANDVNTLALYHFDEINGTIAADASNSANDLTLKNFYRAGKFGNGHYFDGKNGIEEQNAMSIKDTLTLEAWVNWEGANSGNTAQTIVSNGQAGDDGYGIYLYTNNKIGILFCNKAWVVSDSLLPIGKWVHLALVADNGKWTLYENGDSIAGAYKTPNDIIDPSTYFLLGGQTYSPTYHFKGIIDEVRFSDIPRYTGRSFTVPVSSFSSDGNTLRLFHCEDLSGLDSSPYNYPLQVYDVIFANNANPFVMNDNPLPVELTSFTVTASGNGANLAWSTATETNNSGWNVERSNGNQWQTIGFVSGKGTTTAAQSYLFTDSKVTGKVQYRLKQIDNDGNYSYSNVLAFEVLPTSFDVLGNYPNPFNPSTMLRFTLPQTGKVRVVISNVLGQQVAVVADREFNKGTIDLPFNAANLSSGMYYYTITANGKSVTKTMMLMK